MSEQITALLVKIEEDAELQEKFKGAPDLDTAVALAKEAGFEVTEADFRMLIEAARKMRSQETGDLELSDEELAGVAGGVFPWLAAIGMIAIGGTAIGYLSSLGGDGIMELIDPGRDGVG
ncbi:Nif11-like leader peptide family RiPP precursor [Cyanobium sp. T1B-Tous]|uniref:Nif11-like leader peptide family RiPP precursor n=1 Tax=Cyanobium sp. T1B-Tous TaxID=2823721 RepID=UPI0020CBC794|nr:Nif11-like leader peptide family RiPP precursor [Cyanobium sp. T1B-Tous]MCP9807573.1 Nif11-like leader peptide family RiPP precursor [Cyanobium sp. T1B-Tous]